MLQISKMLLEVDKLQINEQKFLVIQTELVAFYY